MSSEVGDGSPGAYEYGGIEGMVPRIMIEY